ncbi:MAG: AraC family transcriptional regulator [Hyphomicrobiales bacterium]|nr:AraC family transcriptional regulator [Hyphomicrobiales bacterium]
MANLNRLGPVPPSSLSLSTTTLPVRDRLPVWREVFGQTMVRLDIEPVKGTSFHAEGELRMLPGAAFAAVTTTPVKVSRTQHLIAGDMADMAFVVTADVPLHIAQNGREQVLDAGDAMILRGNERSVIQSRDRAKFINISVPIDDLTPMLANCRDLSMSVVSRQSDVLDLLLGYVRLLQARQNPLPDELGRVAAGHIRDLMAAMIGPEPDSGPPAWERGGVRAARLRAIKADIGRHFCEPGLSIDAIAMRHSVTPRYVRKLFQEEQTTFSDFVLFLRLERSQQLLRGPAQSISTIASIAHACGFNDLSYFNRTFRRRYGITPTDFRNGAPI